MTASGRQRFNARYPCPICGGYEALPRGQGRRCAGYLGGDGKYAHCSRHELSPGLQEEEGGTYAHRLNGACRCGRTHGESVPVTAVASTNGHRPASDGRTLEASYQYLHADGTPAFEVLRWRLPSREKTFSQRSKVAGGGWIPRCPETVRELYRLPELLAADPELPVFIVEGEKDVDALMAWGQIATTNPLGAGPGKWLPRFSEALRDRWCILVPDNDIPGRAHMAGVAAALRGKTRGAQVLTLPGLPERGDISDWIAAGGSLDALQRLIDAAPILWPLAAAERSDTASVQTFRAADLYDEELPPIRFAIAGILPEGVTLCAGRPKMGKSFLVLNLAIAIAAGVPALGDIAVEQGEVLYLCLEGGKPLLRDRLRGMLPDSRPPPDLTCAVDWPLLPEGGADELEKWLTDHPAARLVIVDTLQKVRPPTTNKQGAYEQDYAAMQTLIALSQRHHVAVLVCHHTRKSGADDIFDTVSGTLGLTGAVDGTWVLQRVRGQDTAVLAITGRSIADQELGLSFDPTLLCWRHTGTGADAKRSTERRMVLQVLEADGGGPLTARNVADLMEADYESVRKTMWRMERSGELQKESRGYVIPLHFK